MNRVTLTQVKIPETYHMRMAKRINEFRRDAMANACIGYGVGPESLSLKTSAPLECPEPGSDETHTWTLTHNTDTWLYGDKVVIQFPPAKLNGETFSQEVIVG